MKAKIFWVFGLLLINAITVKGEDDADEPDNYDVGEEDEDLDTKIEEENGVLVLTNDNFDYAIENNEVILVEFYAPWCGHCKNLAPEYESAAGSLKNHDPPIPLAKVDATVERDLGERFGVSGYPTLKFFKGGEVSDYDGPRDAQGIENWILERSDPDWKPPPDEVVVLTKDNFDEFINGHDLSLVEFYAPWCGHCKKLAPEYSQAASYLKENTDPPVMLAKVDATEETELAQEYGVSGYPTLFMFRRGRKFEYNGGRDKWGIVDYLQKQVGDASQALNTAHDVKLHILKADVTIVGFFDSAEAPEYLTYSDAANELREDFVFFHTFNEDARKEFKANKNSVIMFNPEQFHSKHEPKWRTYEMKEETEASELKDFFRKNCVPLVGELNDETGKNRYNDKKPTVIFFYTVDFSFDYRQATQLWRNKIVEIAKDFKDLTFAIADETKMNTLWKDMGFEDSAEEMNVGILDEKDRRFPMEPMDEFDDDEIRSFIKKFQAGKLKPRIKSQPKPKKQGSVVTVVGNTFEEIVMDRKKDVLIEFYAPWCGHCKNLEPIYKDLGKKYKKEKDLIIAKMDATANDAPEGFDVSGFPTIYWAPKDSKESPVKYEGGRTLDDFVQYLEENSSVLKKSATKEEL